MRKALLVLIIFPALVFAQGTFQQPELLQPKDDPLRQPSGVPLVRPDSSSKPTKKQRVRPQEQQPTQREHKPLVVVFNSDKLKEEAPDQYKRMIELARAGEIRIARIDDNENYARSVDEFIKKRGNMVMEENYKSGSWLKGYFYDKVIHLKIWNKEKRQFEIFSVIMDLDALKQDKLDFLILTVDSGKALNPKDFPDYGNSNKRIEELIKIKVVQAPEMEFTPEGAKRLLDGVEPQDSRPESEKPVGRPELERPTGQPYLPPEEREQRENLPGNLRRKSEQEEMGLPAFIFKTIGQADDKDKTENLKKWLERIQEYTNVINKLREKLTFDELDQLSLNLRSSLAVEKKEEGGIIVTRRSDTYDLEEQLKDLINNKGSWEELELLIEEQLIPYIENVLDYLGKKSKGRKRGQIIFGSPDTDQPAIGRLYNEIADYDPNKNPQQLWGQLEALLNKLKKDLEKLKETKGQEPPLRQGSAGQAPVRLKKKPRIYTGDYKTARPGDVVKVNYPNRGVGYYVIQKRGSMVDSRAPTSDELKVIRDVERERQFRR